MHLQVKTEVSQRGASVTVGQDSFPSFDTRDAETTAVVQDGETLAIGGIITERVTRGRVGVPFLMDIPVFGRFFGTTTDDVDCTELIILITPHVIRNKEEARTITEEFKSILTHVIQEYGWEINNLRRQKRRGLEPVPEKVPTVEPQSSIAPQQQEPQKNARRATIVVPSDPQAYKSLTSSLASSAPASKPNVPGREVRAHAGSNQQSQVVELGNSSIGKGLELAKETQHSEQSNTPTAKAEIPYLEADLTPSGEDQIAPLEKASTELSDESLKQLREDLAKIQAQLGTKSTKDSADSARISTAMEQIPTSMSDGSATVKTPSVGRRASTTESKNNFNDELLSAVVRDLEEKQRSLYRTKETKTRTEQVEPPMTSIQGGQKEPEQSERVSSAWQQVVSSFVDSSLSGNRPTAEPIPLDAAAGEKVSLSSPQPNEPSLIDRESTSLVEEGPVPVETDPIAKDLLKETSREEKKDGRNETGKAGKFETTDATKGVVRDEGQKKAPAPRAAIPSVQELKATLDRMARAARTSDKLSSRSKATDWGIEAKAPGQVVEDTKPSSQKRRAAPSVNRVPAPEQTAFIKTEDLSNAKRAMEEKEKVKVEKEAGEKTNPSEKEVSKNLIVRDTQKVSTSTIAEPKPSAPEVTTPARKKLKVAAKKVVVASKDGEKPSKGKEEIASATETKTTMTPPQKSESAAKEELTKSQAKQKVPVKTEATMVASTTKKQSVKAAETMGQDKEKKADVRKKTARKPMAKMQPTEIATKSPVSETAKKPSEIGRGAGKTSVESTEPPLTAHKPSPEVVADDSAVVAETSSQKKTTWFPLSWFSKSKPEASSQAETEIKPENPKEVARVEPAEASSDNFVRAGSTDSPTKVKQQIASFVKDKKAKSGTPPDAKARASEVSEEQQDSHAEERALDAWSNKSVPSSPGEKSLLRDMEAASAPDKETAPSARTRRSPLGWFSKSQPVIPSPKETQESSEEPREVTKVEPNEAENDDFVPAGPSGLPSSLDARVQPSVQDAVPAPETTPDTGAHGSAQSEGPKDTQKELPVKEPAGDAIVSSGTAQESFPEAMKEDKTVLEDKLLSEKRSWSLLDLFQNSQPGKSALKEPQDSPVKPEEVTEIGSDEVSNQDDIIKDVTETNSTTEEPAQSAISEAPLPKDAESVTIVSINKEQFSESVNETQNKGSVESIIDVTEHVPPEKLVRGSASETSIPVETPKAPVITNEVLEAYNQEVAPVTDSLVPTETATLEAEIAIPSAPGESSLSKKTRWSPLGWWSQTETAPSDQDKIAVSPEEPIETAQGQQSAVETLSQEPGPVSPEELPVMEELTSTGGGRTKSQSNSSWSPLSWFCPSEPVISAQKKTGEYPETSTDPSETNFPDLGKLVPDSTPSLGSNREEPIREDFVPSTGGEQVSLEASVTSPVEGLASSVVGGEATTSIESDPTAQKWFSTVGIRFERNQESPEQQPPFAEEVTNSGVEENGFAVEQTGETPEVVGLVVPFDKEAAKALRETPSGPVESPFTTEESAPAQTNDVEQPNVEVAQAERHVESRVLRFPRANDSHEFQTDYSLRAGQEVPMRLAASDVSSHSSVSVETESFTRRAEPQRSSAETDLRVATNKNTWSSKTGRQGKWSVQIRAYTREGHASSLVNKLQNSRYDAYVVRAKVNGRFWYRVRVGHLDSKRKAKATLASIRGNKTYSQAYVVVNR